MAGEKTARNPRFVTTSKGTAVLNEEALTRAKQLVGLKGYVTNIPITAMPGQEVIDAYHDLWNIEQSFRMSKHDLKARPIFHHQAEAIEAHRRCHRVVATVLVGEGVVGAAYVDGTGSGGYR